MTVNVNSIKIIASPPMQPVMPNNVSDKNSPKKLPNETITGAFRSHNRPHKRLEKSNMAFLSLVTRSVAQEIKTANEHETDALRTRQKYNRVPS